MTMHRDDDEQKIGQNKEMNRINQLIVNTKWNNYKQFFFISVGENCQNRISTIHNIKQTNHINRDKC